MPETQTATLSINTEDARDIAAGLRSANSFFGSVARTPQEVFARVNELKDQLKEKKNELKDCWLQNPDYERVEKEIELLHEKRLALRREINAMYPELVETIDMLKSDLKSEKELFTDMSLIDRFKIQTPGKFRSTCKQLIERGEYETVIIEITLDTVILSYYFAVYKVPGKLISIAKRGPKPGDKKRS